MVGYTYILDEHGIFSGDRILLFVTGMYTLDTGNNRDSILRYHSAAIYLIRSAAKKK